jgi:hypothetical protein
MSAMKIFTLLSLLCTSVFVVGCNSAQQVQGTDTTQAFKTTKANVHQITARELSRYFEIEMDDPGAGLIRTEKKIEMEYGKKTAKWAEASIEENRAGSGIYHSLVTVWKQREIVDSSGLKPVKRWTTPTRDVSFQEQIIEKVTRKLSNY